MRRVLGMALAGILVLPAATIGQARAADRGEPTIITPADGATVTNPVTVKVGRLAMESMAKSMAHHGGHGHDGHLHLLIDAPVPEPGAAVPVDPQHRHITGNTTELRVTLSPGSHRLQLVEAGADHRVTRPPIVSKPVTITVK